MTSCPLRSTASRGSRMRTNEVGPSRSGTSDQRPWSIFVHEELHVVLLPVRLPGVEKLADRLFACGGNTNADQHFCLIRARPENRFRWWCDLRHTVRDAPDVSGAPLAASIAFGFL